MSEQMSKRIVLLKKKDGMSLDDFRHEYESGHAQLILKSSQAIEGVPQRLGYRRCYLAPVETAGTEAGPIFDVQSEAWYASRDELERSMLPYHTDPVFRARIVADEERLFDRDHIQFYVGVDEHVDLAEPTPDALRVLELFRRPADQSVEDFRLSHSRGSWRTMPGGAVRRHIFLDPLPTYCTSPSSEWFHLLVETELVDRAAMDDAVARREPDTFMRAARTYVVREERISDLREYARAKGAC